MSFFGTERDKLFFQSYSTLFVLKIYFVLPVVYCNHINRTCIWMNIYSLAAVNEWTFKKNDNILVFVNKLDSTAVQQM